MIEWRKDVTILEEDGRDENVPFEVRRESQKRGQIPQVVVRWFTTEYRRQARAGVSPHIHFRSSEPLSEWSIAGAALELTPSTVEPPGLEKDMSSEGMRCMRCLALLHDQADVAERVIMLWAVERLHPIVLSPL